MMLPELQDRHTESSPAAADHVGRCSSSRTLGGAVGSADGHDSGDPAHHHKEELPHCQPELSAPQPPDDCREAPLMSPESPSAASSVDSTWARRGIRRRSSTGQDSALSSPRVRFVAPSESSTPSGPLAGRFRARVVGKAAVHLPGQSVGAQQPTVAPSLRQHAWLLHFWDPGEAQQTWPSLGWLPSHI